MRFPRIYRSSLALGLLALPLAATAQTASRPAYTERDIVERFAGLNLGATRGLCIGTEAECPTPAAAPSPMFDLAVTFDYDSDRLTADAKRNLSEFAKALSNNRLQNLSFVVDGHTDANGAEAYNLDLSNRRAQAVVAHLVGLGVDRGKVTAQGHGKSRPRTADPFDPANRRVETRAERGVAQSSR
jgi:OmpA-OmpF porin, OOP family